MKYNIKLILRSIPWHKISSRCLRISSNIYLTDDRNDLAVCDLNHNYFGYGLQVQVAEDKFKNSMERLHLVHLRSRD